MTRLKAFSDIFDLNFKIKTVFPFGTLKIVKQQRDTDPAKPAELLPDSEGQPFKQILWPLYYYNNNMSM